MFGAVIFLYNFWRARRAFYRWSDRESLEVWQDSRVQAHLKRVVARSAWFRALYGGRPLSEWRTFPVIGKDEMMRNFDTYNTANLRRDEVFAIAGEAEKSRNFERDLRGVCVGLSSNTSGNRGAFLVSPAERYAWAGNILGKTLPRSLFTPQRIALFLRAGSSLYRTVDGISIKFSFFDTYLPIEGQISALEELQPTVLAAPPSTLVPLAEAVKDGRLKMRPERIFSLSEVIEPQDIEQIGQIFDQKIHQIYQATEGFLGVTCHRGTLHLNEDVLAFQREAVDDSRFVPILTDFHRFVQPILRYRLDDILVPAKTQCSCGSVFTAIERIEGRLRDALMLGGRPVFQETVRQLVSGAEDYTVTQTDDGSIEVSLILSHGEIDNARRQVRERFEALCRELGCAMPVVTFVDHPRQRPGEKRRRVKRLPS